MCINNILLNVSIFKRWSKWLLKAVMRALGAKWTNIPEIIIPRLDSGPRERHRANTSATMFLQLKNIFYISMLLNIVESHRMNHVLSVGCRALRRAWEPSKQIANQITNQATKQTNNKPTKQPTKQTTGQPNNQPTKKTTKQSTNQLTN